MKCVVLSTGGTIASRVDPETGLLMAGEQTGDELLANCDLPPGVGTEEVVVESVFQIPSNQMTFQKLLFLLDRMMVYAEQGAQGLVITHGTDTLEESAYFLSLLWPYDIPVILTGSQVSPTEPDTDAYSNIGDAVLAAVSPDSRGRGVLLGFNHYLYLPKFAVKIHASDRHGFDAPGCGPVGFIDQDQITYYYPPSAAAVIQRPERLVRVELVKSCMGLDPGLIDFYKNDPGVAGLVVESFGRGHTSPAVAEHIERFAASGRPVVITTTCHAGYVAPLYGYAGSLNDLQTKGACSGGNYQPKKARILLMLLLSAGEDADAIAEAFRHGG